MQAARVQHPSWTQIEERREHTRLREPHAAQRERAFARSAFARRGSHVNRVITGVLDAQARDSIRALSLDRQRAIGAGRRA